MIVTNISDVPNDRLRRHPQLRNQILVVGRRVLQPGEQTTLSHVDAKLLKQIQAYVVRGAMAEGALPPDYKVAKLRR